MQIAFTYYIWHLLLSYDVDKVWMNPLYIAKEVEV